jgi:hypothetical protein
LSNCPFFEEPAASRIAAKDVLAGPWLAGSRPARSLNTRPRSKQSGDRRLMRVAQPESAQMAFPLAKKRCGRAGGLGFRRQEGMGWHAILPSPNRWGFANEAAKKPG